MLPKICQFIKIYQYQLHTIIGMIIFAIAYYVVEELSLIVGVMSNNIIPLWSAVGIGFSVLFLWGYRFWPGLWLGEASHLLTQHTLTSQTLIGATGNTLTILLGVWLVRRFITNQDLFSRFFPILVFTLFGGILVSLLCGFIDIFTLYLYLLIEKKSWLMVWWSSSLTHIVSILVIVPMLITWHIHQQSETNSPKSMETILLWVSLCLITWLVFGQLNHENSSIYLLTLVLISVLIWAALRFSQRKTLLIVFLLSFIAIIRTAQGMGPFAQSSLDNSLLLQTVIIVISLTVLLVTAVIRQHIILEQALQVANESLEKRIAEQNDHLYHSREQLRQVNEKYQSLFIHAIEGIYQISPSHKLLSVNPALAKMYSFESPEEMIAQTSQIETYYVDAEHRAKFHQFLAKNGSVHNFESEIYQKNGDIMWISENSRAVYDNEDNLLYYEGTIIDITERKHAQEPLAHYEPLTDLPNRRLLQVRLKQAMARAKHSGQQGILMCFNLDDFKLVNETLGQEFGDELLKQTAQRLKAGLRETDVVCRLSSDQFLVVAEHVVVELDAVKIAKKLLAQISRPYHYRNDRFQIGVSIGIVFFDAHSNDTETLIHQAILAMYRAKQSGKGTYWFYTSSLEKLPITDE